MQNDRVATLRRAERLAQQGRLDEAIAEYGGLLAEQPRDWNSANVLGDLLVKGGQVPRAIELFTRAAEILARDGFAARACAIYKKILKLRPDDDGALMRAGELSAAQSLAADARVFFNQAADARRRRGEARAALNVVVQMGALDPDDAVARTEAARALIALDEPARAARAFTDLGLRMLEQEREAEALAALREVAALDPANTTVGYLVELLAAGNLAEAAALVQGTAAAPEPIAVPAVPANDETDPEEPPGPAVAAIPADPVPEAAPDLSDAAPDIEEVFARFRRDAVAGGSDDTAQLAYTRGVAFQEAGDAAAAIEQLRMAVRSTHHRHAAAVRLARAFEERRRPADAIEWLGQALDVPGLADAQRCDALLTLSRLLEQEGETARALAACLELQAYGGASREIDERIARLTRAQAGG